MQAKIMKEKDNTQRLCWFFKHFSRAHFYSTHRISGNSFSIIATSIWIAGVSSSKMMSAIWQMTLSNQDELDSWSKDTRLSHIKQLLTILYSNRVAFEFSVWLNWILTIVVLSHPGHTFLRLDLCWQLDLNLVLRHFVLFQRASSVPTLAGSRACQYSLCDH